MDEETVLDGRTRRGRRTREAVVEALLALQEEGDLSPTAARVAERAGVALRTVYGHFADMEALWLEAGARELAKITALADVPPPDRPREERVQRYAASRARIMEALMPVMRATRLRMPSSPQLTRNWRHYIKVGDAEVRAVFAVELTALPPDRAEALVHSLYLLSTGPAWESLRLDRELSVTQATLLFVDGVRALLDAYCPPVPPLPGGAP